MAVTDTDRQRLASILGMLGSTHAGERAAAALQAEAFRKKHGVTWDELLRPPPPEPFVAAAPPPPQPWAQTAAAAPPPHVAPQTTWEFARNLAVMAVGIAMTWGGLILLGSIAETLGRW